SHFQCSSARAKCVAPGGEKDQTACFMFVGSDPPWLLPAIVPSFADLVVIARSPYPIPSRTRPSKSSAPMVLSLKAWKSRSLPGLPRTEHPLSRYQEQKPRGFPRGFFVSDHSLLEIGEPAVKCY